MGLLRYIKLCFLICLEIPTVSYLIHAFHGIPTYNTEGGTKNLGSDTVERFCLS